MEEQQRLDKVLSSQSTYSRSEIKKMMKNGQITVNGISIQKSDIKINPERDTVAVNGKTVCLKQYIYLLMDKPSGVVCAVSDKKDTTVIDIIPEEYKRKGLFPVGRLDKDTQGLLMITNDGEFSHKITSPKTNLYKTYHAVIDSDITPEDTEAFENGIVFKDGTKCRKAFLRQLPNTEEPTVEVKICEGMFHQVKKMLAVRGKKVIRLRRTAIGNLCADSIFHKRKIIEMNYLELYRILFDKLH